MKTRTKKYSYTSSQSYMLYAVREGKGICYEAVRTFAFHYPCAYQFTLLPALKFLFYILTARGKKEKEKQEKDASTYHTMD